MGLGHFVHGRWEGAGLVSSSDERTGRIESAGMSAMRSAQHGGATPELQRDVVEVSQRADTVRLHESAGLRVLEEGR